MLKYITLGIDCKEYFNYDGQPLPIRPLSSYELDQIFLKVAGEIPSSIFNSVVEFKLKITDDEIPISKENYKASMYYYNEIDYWTVYYAMKDFQPEEFSMPDYSEEFKDKFEDWELDNPKGYYLVKSMKYVHDIAEDITNMTVRKEPEIMEILKNSNGKILATMIHNFHVPLVSDAWKLTPLQSNFIWFSRRGAPVEVEEIPGIKGGTIQQVVEQLQKAGLNVG